MKQRAFTLMELLMVVSIGLSLLALSLPFYIRNLRMRAVQSAAQFLEAAIAERKQRAFSLGRNAGLCMGQNVVFVYDYSPFSDGVPSVKPLTNLYSTFEKPVVAVVQSRGIIPTSNPCGQGQANIQLSPFPDGTRDWQGKINLRSGSQEWNVFGQAGGFSSGP